MKLQILFVFSTIFSFAQQNITISGQIISESSVDSISILNLNNKSKIISSIDGKFIINVKLNDTLKVTGKHIKNKIHILNNLNVLNDTVNIVVESIQF